MKHGHWHAHPGVRSGSSLTLGERAADRMRDTMASWRFILGSIAYMALWITVAKLKIAPLDNPQLTYLNLGLSCFAALASSIILLAAKRQDKTTSEVAMHTLRNSDELMGLNRKQMVILERLDGLAEQVSDLAAATRALGEVTRASLAAAKATPAKPAPGKVNR